VALKVVWNNPLPLIRTKPPLQRISSDQFGGRVCGHCAGFHAGV
jgi:hypothetical protein